MTHHQAIELLACPFCGRNPPDDLCDTLYPSGTLWTDHGENFRSYHHMSDGPGQGRVYGMHCTESEGGCGASIYGDSEAEAIAAWNRRAAPASEPAVALENAEWIIRQIADLDDNNNSCAVFMARQYISHEGLATPAAPEVPAPAASEPDAAFWREMLEAVMREFPRNMVRSDGGNAPGHCHSIPGVWDSDNGAKAGTKCAWCMVWNKAKAEIESSRATTSKSIEGGGDGN